MAVKMPTVLVVEDELLIRMSLCDFLEDQGFRVLDATNVLDAVALLGQHRVDLVITDIDMPGGRSGIDLAWLVDTSQPAVKVVVVYGGNVPSAGDLPKGTQFLQKPYRLEDIMSSPSALVKERSDLAAEKVA